MNVEAYQDKTQQKSSQRHPSIDFILYHVFLWRNILAFHIQMHVAFNSMKWGSEKKFKRGEIVHCSGVTASIIICMMHKYYYVDLY